MDFGSQELCLGGAGITISLYNNISETALFHFAQEQVLHPPQEVRRLESCHGDFT